MWLPGVIPNLIPLPPVNFGPQLKFGNLHQLTLDIAQEVALFQNAPGFSAIHQLLQQQQQQLMAINHQLQLLTNAVNSNQARYCMDTFLPLIAPAHLTSALIASQCNCTM